VLDSFLESLRKADFSFQIPRPGGTTSAAMTCRVAPLQGNRYSHQLWHYSFDTALNFMTRICFSRDPDRLV